MTRLENLWEFVETNLEEDFGYLPCNCPMDKEEDVDKYISFIKKDFKTTFNSDNIKKEEHEEFHMFLEGIDDI